VPWYNEPTAQVICDAFGRNGKPVSLSPRQVLRQVIDLYAARGWKALVAPELEFYLVAKNVDPDYPLQPPVGRSGRPESGAPVLWHRCGERIRSSISRTSTDIVISRISTWTR
jgi:glutamine synthetase